MTAPATSPCQRAETTRLWIGRIPGASWRAGPDSLMPFCSRVHFLLRPHGQPYLTKKIGDGVTVVTTGRRREVNYRLRGVQDFVLYAGG